MATAAIKHMASNFAKLDKFEGGNHLCVVNPGVQSESVNPPIVKSQCDSVLDERSLCTFAHIFTRGCDVGMVGYLFFTPENESTKPRMMMLHGGLTQEQQFMCTKIDAGSRHMSR
ncbi:hypothetical protein Tco_0548682 [Tanacetum coccineum]